MNKEFIVLKEQDNSLKIDKEIIEIQKTIIYYGNRILECCEHITLHLESIINHKINEKDKEKQITIMDQPETKKSTFISHLEKLKDVNK